MSLRTQIDPRRWLSQAKAVATSRLAISSLHLATTQAVTSLLGYLYWVAAARFFSVAVVGQTSALVSTMFLTAILGNMSLGLGLTYILPTAGRRWGAIINSVMLAVVLFSVLGSLVVVVITAVSHIQTGITLRSTLFISTFVLTNVMWTLTIVVDQVLTVEQRSELIILRSVCSSLVRLVALIAVVFISFAGSAIGLFAIWGVSAAISVPLVAFVFARKNTFGHHFTWQFDAQAVREVFPLSLRNHALTALDAVSVFALPLVVASFLSNEANAYFYTAFMVASLLYAVPVSVARALFAHGAAITELGHETVVRALYLTLAIVTPAALAIIMARRLILLFFGKDYIEHGGPILVALACSAIPICVIYIYLGAQQVRRDFRRAISVAILRMATTLAAVALAVMRGSLLGVGLALCASHLAVALFCYYDLWLRPNGTKMKD